MLQGARVGASLQTARRSRSLRRACWRGAPVPSWKCLAEQAGPEEEVGVLAGPRREMVEDPQQQCWPHKAQQWRALASAGRAMRRANRPRQPAGMTTGVVPCGALSVFQRVVLL